MAKELDPKKIIELARENRALRSSEDYIDSQINFDWLADLTFQMGPNCNLHCKHCYAGCGPKVVGLPRLEVVRRTLEQAVENHFETVTLTDGEAIREPNREVLAQFCKFSKDVPLRVLTNASFASSYEEAKKWFEFMQGNGFDAAIENNRIQVSAGRVYAVHRNNHIWLNKAFKDVFPGADPGDKILYTILMEGSEGKNAKFISIINRLFGLKWVNEDNKFAFFITRVLDYVYGEKDKPNRVDKLTNVGIPSGDYGGFAYFPTEGSPIIARYDAISPQGRGRKMSIFKNMKERKINPAEIPVRLTSINALYIFNNGEVSWGDTVRCATRQKSYGNVLEESLKQIKDKISSDVIYLAYRLGDVRFLYYLAKQVSPDLTISGLQKCDVCKTIKRDEPLLDKIRERWDPKGLVNTYRQYIQEFNI